MRSMDRTIIQVLNFYPACGYGYDKTEIVNSVFYNNFVCG